jgi:hypothetical protein
VAEREIVSIIWHESSDQVDLIYVDGQPDRLIGARSVVTELAESVGLVNVAAPPGTLQWVRDPQTSE